MKFIGPRTGVSALFFMNGYLIGNWAPEIPEFASRHSLDESQIGLMIAVFGLGSLLTMPITGLAIARYGMAPATKLTSLIAATTLFWLILSPNIYAAVFAIFIFGSFIAGMDVAMNAMAVEVERALAKPIMSSCHGFWSLGGLFGTVGGGHFIQTFGSLPNGVIALSVAVVLVGLAWKHITNKSIHEAEEKHPIRFPKTLLPYLVGVMALFSAMPEGAIIDWSALYLRQEHGADVLTSSLAFGTFSATMAIVRFLGDPIRGRLGAVTTVKICSLLAASGLLLAGLASSKLLVVTGFAIAGLGMSNLVPIAFSAAGNLPGLAPGIGLSLATTIGYSGVLVAPAILGYIAEFTGFAILFSSLAGLLIVVFALSSNLRHADFDPG